MKKYQTIRHPEGDSHIKFLSVVKAMVFHRDFVVVLVTELISVLLRPFWDHLHFSLYKICNYSVNGWLEVIRRDTENLFGRDWRGRTHMTHTKMYWALCFYKCFYKLCFYKTVYKPAEHKWPGSHVLCQKKPVLALPLGSLISLG